MARDKVVEGNRETAKTNIRFFYELAVKANCLDKLMEIANVKNIKSLTWSYEKGKISQGQLDAYMSVLKADRNHIVGEKELTNEDKLKYEAINLDSKIQPIDNLLKLSDMCEYDTYLKRIHESNDKETLEKIIQEINSLLNVAIIKKDRLKLSN